MSGYNFQYCQKIVVFSNDLESVLLCKRKGENDYDGVYSFIGGKMENTDDSFIAGLQREKNEEVGEGFKVEIYPTLTVNSLFKKKSGDFMVLPHYFARHISGDVKLNEEYSDFKWVKIIELKDFEPKIPGIPKIVEKLISLKNIAKQDEMVAI